MKVLVVEDEPLARRRLIRMLGRIADVDVVGEASDGQQALERMREQRPDVVLLDIRMPGLDGLQLATSAPDLPPIIFTTAYDEYAVRAFEASAVDYLMKPIDAERLQQALEKAARANRVPDADALARLLREALDRSETRRIPRITARAGKTIRVFDAREISRFHASDRYTVFRHSGQEFVLDDTLTSLEQRLGAHGFVRVHRAELVNLDHIRALRLEDGGTALVLDDDQVAPVSRRLVPELKRRLGMSDAS